MSIRLGRIALLAQRASLFSNKTPVRSLVKHAVTARKITTTSVVREQYLQGYKDAERFHGKTYQFICSKESC